MQPRPLLGHLLSLFLTTVAFAQAPPETGLTKQNDAWSLLRDGEPFVIHGAGGSASKKLLAELGGNSFRTWGTDNLDAQLDEAQKLGLAVTVGLWMGHERHG